MFHFKAYVLQFNEIIHILGIYCQNPQSIMDPAHASPFNSRSFHQILSPLFTKHTFAHSSHRVPLETLTHLVCLKVVANF